MGKSQSNTSSSSSSKPIWIDTNMSNPFYHTTTDKNGNVSSTFVNGTAGKQAYDYVNNNISGLLDNYLKPSLDNVTAQAKLNQFNKQQQANLQNNILNPLANNNMIRSSQATNMYNNLSNQAADYANNLLASAQDDTWNMINNLMSMYSNAYTGMNNDTSTLMEGAVGKDTKTYSNSKV